MARMVLGIDVGINGALACYDGTAVHILDVPTTGEDSKRRVNAAAVWPWLDQHKPVHAFIEYVNAMPAVADESGTRRSMGTASAFRFGDTAGSLRTVVVCCGIPFRLVMASKWKHHYGLIKTDKEASRQKAIDLLPAHANLFARKLDQNRAESCLIAMYGWHELRKGT